MTLNGGWGWSLFGVVWGVAAVGTVLKVFYTGRYDRLSTAAYVALGWVAVVAIVPLTKALPLGGLLLLVIGGGVYTLGALTYLWERLPFNHAVWHLFVLGGSACHFSAVLVYIVLPA